MNKEAIQAMGRYVNPAELNDIEDLRQALHQANLELVKERMRLQACMEATDTMVATLGRLVSQYMAKDAEAIANTLAGFVKNHCKVINGAAGSGMLQ